MIYYAFSLVVFFFALGVKVGEWSTNNHWIDTHKRQIANFCRKNFWYVLTEEEYCGRKRG